MRLIRSIQTAVCIGALSTPLWAQQNNDIDALNLQSAPVTDAAGRKVPFKLFLEGAVGRHGARSLLRSVLGDGGEDGCLFGPRSARAVY